MFFAYLLLKCRTECDPVCARFVPAVKTMQFSDDTQGVKPLDYVLNVLNNPFTYTDLGELIQYFWTPR